MVDTNSPPRGPYGDQRFGTAPAPAGAEASSVMPIGRVEGVLGRRAVAYVIDVVVLGFLVVLFGFLIGIAGFLTFGLTWGLYAILVPGTAILYSAVTIGGPSMGTVGMRLAGLAAVDATNGGRQSPLIAGLHALLFYVGIGTVALYVLDIVIGFARADRRLGHDLLTDIIVIRR